MARTVRTHAATLRALGLDGTAPTVARILAYWHRATPADVAAGASWYGADSMAILSGLVSAGLPSLDHAAAVVSHLSPRTSWGRNVAGAYGMAASGTTGARAVGCMAANVGRAAVALASDTPLGTFGPSAHKTRAFARNLLGDRDSVTVDVWAARVAMGKDGRTAEKLLKRAGAYAAVADAYRIAAASVGVDATTMQATTWVVARNGRSL